MLIDVIATQLVCIVFLYLLSYKERPKLQLQPRSKPTGSEEDKQSTASSIFGQAKPVDTLKKELEIERRLKEKEEAEKREADERHRKGSESKTRDGRKEGPQGQLRCFS